MKLNATNNTIIVTPEFEDLITNSGIYLKERGKQKPPNVGVVVSVGKEVTSIKVGERIVFHTKKNNPEGFYIDGEAYIHIEDDEVYAKL